MVFAIVRYASMPNCNDQVVLDASRRGRLRNKVSGTVSISNIINSSLLLDTNSILWDKKVSVLDDRNARETLVLPNDTIDRTSSGRDSP